MYIISREGIYGWNTWWITLPMTHKARKVQTWPILCAYREARFSYKAKIKKWSENFTTSAIRPRRSRPTSIFVESERYGRRTSGDLSRRNSKWDHELPIKSVGTFEPYGRVLARLSRQEISEGHASQRTREGESWQNCWNTHWMSADRNERRERHWTLNGWIIIYHDESNSRTPKSANNIYHI